MKQDPFRHLTFKQLQKTFWNKCFVLVLPGSPPTLPPFHCHFKMFANMYQPNFVLRQNIMLFLPYRCHNNVVCLVKEKWHSLSHVNNSVQNDSWQLEVLKYLVISEKIASYYALYQGKFTRVTIDRRWLRILSKVVNCFENTMLRPAFTTLCAAVHSWYTLLQLLIYGMSSSTWDQQVAIFFCS